MVNTTITPTQGALTATGQAGTATGLDYTTLPIEGKVWGFRTAAVTTEQGVRIGPCRVFGVYPEVASTAGTITLRNTGGGAGVTAKHICPIATLSAGKTFGPKGVDFPLGLTVQISNAADLALIVGESI